MKTHLSIAVLTAALTQAHALRVPRGEAPGLEPPATSPGDFRPLHFSVRPRQNSASNTQGGSLINLTSQTDFAYLVDVNVGGQNFSLHLDTGSSDLWVYSPAKKLDFHNESSTYLNLTYGKGAATGKVAYFNFTMGGYSIPNQAFLNVDKMVDFDVEGIFPLGFDAHSDVYGSVSNATRGGGKLNSAAQPPMANIFQLNSTAPNFVGIAIERTSDGESVTGGSLSVGQYDPRFSNISQAAHNAVVPPKTKRWTIGMDKFEVNGKDVALRSSVPGAASKTGVALIDCGTSLAYIPVGLVNAIYSTINGAKHFTNKTADIWIVPCMGLANLTMSFGGQAFAIDPLDLTTTTNIVQNNKNYTICVNTFMKELPGFGTELDYLLGDTFMRNVYSVLNFGNATLSGNFSGAPSIQMLSRTIRDDVYSSFAGRRNATLSKLPPLLAPKDVDPKNIKPL